MRLAFIKKRFSAHGGAELYLKSVLSELKKDGHELHIFANRWTDEKGLIYHKLNIIPWTSFLSAFTFNRSVGSHLRKERFDCVISFERTERQDIYRAGDGCHKAWLDIRSAFEPLYKRQSFAFNPFHIYTLALEKKIFAETPLVIANSKLVKEQIQRYYQTPDERVYVVYNGVDLARFSPDNCGKWRDSVRQELGLSHSDRILLFIGTGFIRKGLDLLIKTLPYVKRRFFNGRIKALVIGKGDISGYSKKAHKAGVGDIVKFLGVRKEIEKYYAAADIFVLPTLYDPFSNACLEAMASGLPVITTLNNGASELIEDGKEGFVIESEAAPEELSDRIVSSLENAAMMGERARAKAEAFSIEEASEGILKLISRVVS